MSNTLKKQNEEEEDSFAADARAGFLQQYEIIAAQLLPHLVRKKLTQGMPERMGGSVFFNVKKSWEAKVLKEQSDIVTVHNSWEIEEAFRHPEWPTLFIPHTASIAKKTVHRICASSGMYKTIFYEVVDHE